MCVCVCDYAMYVCEQGVVYRDVKPGNFLFTTPDPSTRRLKATDFGMAVL
jgi:serine/threonine protein kinase